MRLAFAIVVQGLWMLSTIRAAELTIPWPALGYAPQPGQTIPFDVPVIFSDATGARNMNYSWWRSVSADAHANNDIPTEIRLDPAEWGKLLLK